MIDRRLLERDELVLEAGNHDESIRMGLEDLVEATDAQVADISQD